MALGRGYARDADVNVLVKGGHLDGDRASNALVAPDGATHVADVPRVATTNTHGTGCSLSSALATRMAHGDANSAVTWASDWLHEAIAHADELHVGQGHGPVHHFHRLYRLAGGV